MNMPLFLTFLVAISLLTITPGVDTAMVLRTAATQGHRPAALASLGVALGCLIWGAVVSLGLGALLRASAWAYDVVKFVGAAYLFWLGARLLWQPRSAILGQDKQARPRSDGAAFWRGLLTNLLNPKIGVFYVTFLPQFVPGDVSVASYTFFLACVHVALTLVWFGMLILAAAPLTRLLQRPAALKILDRLTGCVFVTFGIKLAVSSSH